MNGLPTAAEPLAWLAPLVRGANRAGKRWRREMETLLAPCELNEQEFHLLWLHGPCSGQSLTQADLAEQLAVSPAQISGAVERLRSRGLLASQRDAADRRRQTWRLTEAGQQVLADAENCLRQWASATAARLAPHELSVLQRALDRLADDEPPRLRAAS